MVNLSKYIKESLLDDEDIVFNDDNIKPEIKKFIEDNYRCVQFTISNKPNKDGKFVVDGKTVQVINKNITSLTNNLFIWGKVKGEFNCSKCDSLTSLEGAPEKTDGRFSCNSCNSLTSLKGAPKKVNGRFDCSYCHSLETLEGAPEKLSESFFCSYCNSLTSLEGAPKEVGESFFCSCCKYLTSLEGAPEKIGGGFICIGNKFSIKDIKKVVKAIYIKIR